MARDSRGRFASQAERIAAEMTAAIEKASIALTLQVDRNLRRSAGNGGTPVDTGHARANWIPSVGAPFTGEVSGEAAHGAGVAAVVGFKLGQGDLFVSNNATYIALLNLGFSHQAAAGFIEACIDEAIATISARFTSLDFGNFADDVGASGAAGIASSYSPLGGD